MTYFKEHKGQVILTTLITLLPMAVGLVLWNQLPDLVPTHFGADGQADDWTSKPWAVFFMPCALAALHLFCLLVTGWDPKNKNRPRNMAAAVWVCPVISLLAAVVSYGTALGYPVDVNFIVILAMGGIFALLSLYLPHCKQNYTVGIKLPWTLKDEATWDYTHQLAGKVWLYGSMAIILTSFLRNTWVLLVILVVMLLVPTVASYRFYQKRAGDGPADTGEYTVLEETQKATEASEKALKAPETKE